jgi:hypothetical protein
LLLNCFAQPHKLIYALVWLHVTFTLKIVHRGGADRTVNHLVLIEHRKLNDHPIEIVALHLTSSQRHCKFSTMKELNCSTLIGRCHFERDDEAGPSAPIGAILGDGTRPVALAAITSSSAWRFGRKSRFLRWSEEL